MLNDRIVWVLKRYCTEKCQDHIMHCASSQGPIQKNICHFYSI